MKEINLKELKIYKTLDKSDYETNINGEKIPNYVICDGCKEIANFLYKEGSGLACHALAYKIWNAREEGIVVINKEEEEILISAINQAIPSVIDAFNERLANAKIINN